MPHAATRAEMLQTLERLLVDLLQMRSEGATCDRMGKAQGLLDGYMRALMESGAVSEKELLRLVSRLREELRGPATRESTPERCTSGAAVAA